MTSGAQAHFYLETFNAMAIPGNYDEMTVIRGLLAFYPDKVEIAAT